MLTACLTFALTWDSRAAKLSDNKIRMTRIVNSGQGAEQATTFEAGHLVSQCLSSRMMDATKFGPVTNCPQSKRRAGRGSAASSLFRAD